MRAIDAATTTNSSTSPAANAIATAAANEPRIAPQNTTGRHHSPSDARRLRFAQGKPAVLAERRQQDQRRR